MTKRKSPIRHIVHSHLHKGKVVQSFTRGNGINTTQTPKLADPRPSKPHTMFRIYFDSKSIMHSAVKYLSETYPHVDVGTTDMDQLQWIDVYGMTGRDFLLKNYKHSITSIDKISLTKPKVDRPEWAKGMHKEGWWWIDRHGKKWTKGAYGEKTEVNMNKEYI